MAPSVSLIRQFLAAPNDFIVPFRPCNLPYKLVRLASGDYSVHSLAHQETFHPVIGPVAEAEALYLKQARLADRLKEHKGEFVIWDVGLGAAANALTVLRGTEAIPSRIHLLSFDHTLEPLAFALQHPAELPYLRGYETHLRKLINAITPLDWKDELLHVPDSLNHGTRGRSSLQESTDHVSYSYAAFDNGAQSRRWEFFQADFPSLLNSAEAHKLAKPHAIMFDAFSPAKNPAMWTQPLFLRLFQLLDPLRPCALPTYSRSTMLRVTLLLAGFFVGVGHATGEKEETTIAANDLRLIDEPLDRRWLARARRSHSAEPMTEPVYRIAPLTTGSWEKLQAHPQFGNF